uniref:Uncharacterized protein n=1 Tax=Anguilla anguilla TaxID=7936 RepID=A0A0E9QH40_ANGAN
MLFKLSMYMLHKVNKYKPVSK